MTGVSSLTNITNSVFERNNAGSGPGGALFASSGPSLIVSGSEFDRNSGSSGGAIYAQVCFNVVQSQLRLLRI